MQQFAIDLKSLRENRLKVLGSRFSGSFDTII